MIIKTAHGKRVGIHAKENIKYKPFGIYITRPEIPPFGRGKYIKGIYCLNFRWKLDIFQIMFNFRKS